MFIFEVDFVLKSEDNLCLFALSWYEIKHKTKHFQGYSSSFFIPKKLIQGKSKLTDEKKMNVMCRNKDYKKINSTVPFYGQVWHDSRIFATTATKP